MYTNVETESQHGLTNIAEVQVCGQKKLRKETLALPLVSNNSQREKQSFFISGPPCGSLGFISILGPNVDWKQKTKVKWLATIARNTGWSIQGSLKT